MSQSDSPSSLLGEFRRTIDERYRLSLPTEFVSGVTDESSETIVVKERAGCLSLWRADAWEEHFQAGLDVIEQKIQSHRLQQQWTEVQRLGRLVSTRSKRVQIAGRGRLLIPDGFRDFLAASPNDEVVLVGALLCVEIWNTTAWLAQLQDDMPSFNQLFTNLSS